MPMYGMVLIAPLQISGCLTLLDRRQLPLQSEGAEVGSRRLSTDGRRGVLRAREGLQNVLGEGAPTAERGMLVEYWKR